MSKVLKLFKGTSGSSSSKSSSSSSRSSSSSGSKSKPRSRGGAAPSPQEAINRLRETEAMLTKKQEYLEKKIEQEIIIAKKNGTKNKRAALQALKRKKRFEQQLTQIDGTLSTIEFEREALENANTNTEVLKNMSYAAKAIKGVNQNMFATYNHLMAFWELIEPATHQMIRVTSSKKTRETDATRKPTPTLPTIDEFFMFMMHLALGLMQRDLAHRFHVHQSTVSRIITSWANFLFFLLGSVCIWMPKEKVQAHLPQVV